MAEALSFGNCVPTYRRSNYQSCLESEWLTLWTNATRHLLPQNSLVPIIPAPRCVILFIDDLADELPKSSS